MTQTTSYKLAKTSELGFLDLGYLPTPAAPCVFVPLSTSRGW
ncbi:MAG: hypothetical protein ACHBN1_04385 [Heteroscytonema crispum UTEX LB 1556]